MCKKLILIILAAVFFAGCNPAKEHCSDSDEIVNVRPEQGRYLFDRAGIFEDIQEYCDEYLEGVNKNFFIEMLIITLPSLEGQQTIEEAAAEIFSNWKIGKTYGGRGILLLLVNDTKRVKLEVGYELEDVFTDVFCGYVEDVQLKNHFLSGRVDIGFLALSEEIERRAGIKEQDNYTPGYIAELDRKFLSGGAGAVRDLSKYKKEKVTPSKGKYPPGKTPDEAWQTRIQSYRDKSRDPNKGVNTECTKLYFRDFTNSSDASFDKYVRKYASKPYRVVQNQDYAIIFFGAKKGWDNAPIFFCRTPEGWKYDLVHQAKYRRMGPNPHWAIEQADFPYYELSVKAGCYYDGSWCFEGQDIPLEGEDIYRIEDDPYLAQKIVELEEDYTDNPDDFETAMELGKLYTIVSSRRGMKVLKRAKKLNPQSPLPYKYLAIRNLDAFYQYNYSVQEIKEYIKREPNDVFGHNFLGYLYYQLAMREPDRVIEYSKLAIEQLKKAIELRPDNCYAYCKLARCYGLLYLNTSKLDVFKEEYRRTAFKMLREARNVTTPNNYRIEWVEWWFKDWGVL